MVAAGTLVMVGKPRLYTAGQEGDWERMQGAMVGEASTSAAHPLTPRLSASPHVLPSSVCTVPWWERPSPVVARSGHGWCGR